MRSVALSVVVLIAACNDRSGVNAPDAAAAGLCGERPDRPDCPTGCHVFDCDSPCAAWCWETCVDCTDNDYDGTWEWTYSTFDCFGCLDDAGPEIDAPLDIDAGADAGAGDADADGVIVDAGAADA